MSSALTVTGSSACDVVVHFALARSTVNFDQRTAMLCVPSAGIPYTGASVYLVTASNEHARAPSSVLWDLSTFACLPFLVSDDDSALRLVEEVLAPADHSGCAVPSSWTG
eukprot:4137600-Amphidinium_carterae.3